IIPRNTEGCASGQIKKCLRFDLKWLRHPYLDETGCFSSCRPRRKSCVRKPLRHEIASLSSPLPAECTAATASKDGDDTSARTTAAAGAGAIGSALACSPCSCG